jgi:light-regulated signal transduction histidine kinase (bacteriophytochrome)
MEISQLQQRVREHVVELEAANKELETFSYSVSHDLRAPLRAISGFSNILVENFATVLPGEGRQLLNKIIQSADRMGQLIEHLLRFARLSRQSLIKRPVQIEEMVREIWEEIVKEQPERETQIRIGALPDAVGDAILLRQVFFNLLSNAFKFTRQKDQPVIEVGTEKQGEETVYFVRDNGAGFDMQYAGNLFRVFYRLHSATEFEGTGVGLSLVQRIIQRHGGNIWVEAAVGQGATFYFTLPADAQPAQRSA